MPPPQEHASRRGWPARAVLFGLALAVFVGGAIFSFRQLHLSPGKIGWWWLALVAGVGGPATLLLNAAEFRSLAQMAYVDLPFRHALRATAVAAGLNWLPLPAAAVTRVAVLGQAGIGLPRASTFVLNMFLIWAGMAMTLVGLAVSATAFPLGILVAGGGGCVVAGGGWLFRRMGAPGGLVARAVVYRLLLLALDALRLWFCLRALGLYPPLWRAAAIAASSVLGSAGSAVPAGLAVHELGAALLAPLAGLPGGAGFLAAGLNRAAGLLAVPALLAATALRPRTPNDGGAAGGGPRPAGGGGFSVSHATANEKPLATCRAGSEGPGEILLLCVNYRTAEQTLAFVESAVSLPGAEKLHVHVVDNSGEGASLIGSFAANHPGVCYLPAPRNLGYLRGAQLGFDAFVRKHGLPELTVVSNTDISFPDRLFWRTLLSRRPVRQVTAPSIQSVAFGQDQNPYLANRPGPIILALLRLFWSSYPAYLVYLGLQFALRTLKSCRRASPKEAKAIYAPHGSFIVIGREFFQRGGSLDVGTFLFGEELLLAERAMTLGVPVRYEPDLRVIHEEHVTTGFFKSRRHYEASREAVRLYVNLRRGKDAAR